VRFPPGGRFVDEAPEDADLLDRRDELTELNGLDHKGVDPEFITLDHVALLA
jgi:hypothetical protein